MKKYRFSPLALLCLLITILPINYTHAQKKIKGKLSEYTGQEADIMVGLMELKVIGSISENGSFQITPPGNYLEEMTASMENNQQGGFTVSMRMVEDAFGNCENSTVEIENGDQPLLNLSTQNSFVIGKFNSPQDLDEYGYMALSNDRDFAFAILSYQQGSASKGYVLDWYYFEEPASVKGVCKLKSYTHTQREEDLFEQVIDYDLDFKKGWNLVRYEYADIYTDSANKTYASKINYHTLKKMPKEASFYFFQDQ